MARNSNKAKDKGKDQLKYEMWLDESKTDMSPSYSKQLDQERESS